MLVQKGALGVLKCRIFARRLRWVNSLSRARNVGLVFVEPMGPIAEAVFLSMPYHERSLELESGQQHAEVRARNAAFPSSA